MDYLAYTVLENRRKGFSQEEAEQCYAVLERLATLQLIAKKEGLLALEEYGCELDKKDAVLQFLKDCLLLIVDGSDPEDVEQILSKRIVFHGTDTFRAYLEYVILSGGLMIQAGKHERILLDSLLSCVPEECREEADRRMENARDSYRSELRNRNMSNIKRWYPRKSNNPFLPIVIDKLNRIDDDEMKHLLEWMDFTDILILLTYVPEGIRTRMLNQAVPEVGMCFFEEVHYYTDEEVARMLRAVMTTVQ